MTVKHKWEEWEVPPLSHYIDREHQWEVTKARTDLARVTHSVCIAVGNLDLFFQARMP